MGETELLGIGTYESEVLRNSKRSTQIDIFSNDLPLPWLKIKGTDIILINYNPVKIDRPYAKQ